jgi:hypothetical protein
MDATLGCGRPQKRPQKRPQLEFLRFFCSPRPLTARAVQGGEAEAPTCRRRPFTARRVTPDHNGVGWPGTGRPTCPILAWQPGRSPARRTPGGAKAVGHRQVHVCVYRSTPIVHGMTKVTRQGGSGSDWSISGEWCGLVEAVDGGAGVLTADA